MICGKERKDRTKFAGSGVAQVPDSMGVGAAEALQKLRQKLAAQGKQHLETYAADWEMGTSGAKVSRTWFKLPHGRKIFTFSEAINVLEDMHASNEGMAAAQPGIPGLPLIITSLHTLHANCLLNEHDPTPI